MNNISNRIPLALLTALAITLGVVANLNATSALRRAAEPTAVAVIDWLAATEKLDLWRSVQADLKDFKEQRQQESDVLKAKLREMKDTADILPPGSENQKKALDELELESLRVQAWLQFTETRIARRELEAQLLIYKRITETVATIAERDGWDLVLWNDSASKEVDLSKLQDSAQLISTRHVFYARSAMIDITETVVQRMNNDFKSGQSP